MGFCEKPSFWPYFIFYHLIVNCRKTYWSILKQISGKMCLFITDFPSKLQRPTPYGKGVVIEKPKWTVYRSVNHLRWPHPSWLAYTLKILQWYGKWSEGWGGAIAFFLFLSSCFGHFFGDPPSPPRGQIGLKMAASYRPCPDEFRKPSFVPLWQFKQSLCTKNLEFDRCYPALLYSVQGSKKNLLNFVWNWLGSWSSYICFGYSYSNAG